ncbi:MAG TPA: 4-hydroxy-tetrahydrodipicolinate synthase [Dehalococcoidia bacterium]|nr:4-hydroxy-tetrahydrodipicolinate synthase [Dehalococcoidia bacterium]
MELGRLLTAMVTPFDNEGKVDYAQAKRLAQALLDSGSDGLVIAGTTGESPTLSHDEKIALFREVKSAVGHRGSVVAGTGTYNTQESIDLTREAQAAGVDAVLLTTPYYSKPPQEGLFRHFEAIAASTSLPCVIYNIPHRTAVNLTVETQMRLAAVPNIAGVKESSGDLGQIAEICRQAPPTYRVWSGDDPLTLPIMAVGGYGAVSVVAHLVGTQIKQMIDAYVDGNALLANDINARLMPLINTIMVSAPNPIGIKYALRQVGFPAGGYRLPLVEPDAQAADKITAAVNAHQIDLAVAV